MTEITKCKIMFRVGTLYCEHTTELKHVL